MCCVLREGVPLYLYRSLGGVGGYSWREDWLPPPSHVTMPPPVEGGAKQHWQGVARPLTVASRHRLRMVGRGLDMDHCSVGFCLG
jgi:hypothetical protein